MPRPPPGPGTYAQEEIENTKYTRAGAKHDENPPTYAYDAIQRAASITFEGCPRIWGRRIIPRETDGGRYGRWKC